MRDLSGGASALHEEIKHKFGAAVLEIVEGCTDTDIVPKPLYRARKEAYIHHLRDAPAPVRLVSCADKLHNARAILADLQTIGNSLWRRFKAAVKTACGITAPSPMSFCTTGRRTLQPG